MRAVRVEDTRGLLHLEHMLRSIAAKGAEIGCCAGCLDTRGICDDRLAPRARRSSLDELTDWTLWADQVLVF